MHTYIPNVRKFLVHSKSGALVIHSPITMAENETTNDKAIDVSTLSFAEMHSLTELSSLGINLFTEQTWNSDFADEATMMSLSLIATASVPIKELTSSLCWRRMASIGSFLWGS
jgi:hypothetical protein